MHWLNDCQRVAIGKIKKRKTIFQIDIVFTIKKYSNKKTTIFTKAYGELNVT